MSFVAFGQLACPGEGSEVLSGGRTKSHVMHRPLLHRKLYMSTAWFDRVNVDISVSEHNIMNRSLFRKQSYVVKYIRGRADDLMDNANGFQWNKH